MFFSRNQPPREALETTRSIALQGRRVDYRLVRRRGRRGVGLKVDGSGMTVAASLTMPLAVIDEMIGNNAAWVLKKLAEWSERRIEPQIWQTGTVVQFLGEPLTLMVDANTDRAGRKPLVERLMGHLFVRGQVGDAQTIETAVVHWYKQQALPHLAQRALSLATQHGIQPPRVFLSNANSRWGSCNSRREVRFSWRLMKARPALIDYVVCHELAHLLQMNHSAAFWREVEMMCPDYRDLIVELNVNDYKFRGF